MPRLLDRIVEGGLCQGCGGCASAIGSANLAMAMSEEGYLRPRRLVPPSAAEDEVVARVCSGYTVTQSAPGAVYDNVWGPILSLHTGWATDPDVRYQGSSGGVISAIAIHLIQSKQVDFVLQSRASTLDPIGVETGPSETRSEVIAAAGSRYTPSAPLANLHDFLSGGRRFAFVGRPCDVAALRRMARYDPRIDQQIPIMLSFFCAGVPSRKGAIAVLKALGVEHDQLEAFAYRGRGWPGLARARRRDGTEASMDYNASWGTILNRYLQFRCKICPDGTGEFADIVCADAWHGKDGYPDFAEADGRSLVVARTEKGKSLLDAVSAARAVSLRGLSIDDIRPMQPYQHDRKKAVMARLAALALKRRITPKFRGLSLWALTFRSSPALLLRNMIGTFRRIPAKRIEKI